MRSVTPMDFILQVKQMRLPNTFNPYVQQDEQHDKPRASEIRERVLFEILNAAADLDIDSVWIGRDLGYRGGRRTGLALTDDFRFFDHTKRWKVETERPTFGPMMRERTANVVWEMLQHIEEHIFLWNIFPLHPFPEGNVYANRAHKAVERRAGEQLLQILVSLLRPRRIVALGNDASEVLKSMFGTKIIDPVRHPSYGGENLFREQICSLYGL